MREGIISYFHIMSLLNSSHMSDVSKDIARIGVRGLVQGKDN